MFLLGMSCLTSLMSACSLFCALISEYQAYLDQNNAYDFNDLLIKG